ncbi:peptidoglycan-binding protein [Clostridium tagluense]|uniref:peptidoglycan-binding domain-containing protein n=1 Tax=Clostridium tagluense TaxID=360422 RepID=UPI001CF52446|nr:peptidoglycan-binding domain-containing protein [Clostridium tagluense]MCB2314265.1 peptidoglycan-binding protein [Clostridium tagluense]MCB2318823.1 peptidoglycan-binding protein [Clostridium tagluense]MCB2324015.1 peptidoglycan-binding protein [Clostridium tagluense]MCB2328863.1 peptidoglycan-binding protein [Clostridium tagluense]MCB2333714.1 peptidoglycan-binding protein [Clostridium tagluense]
MNKKIQKTLAMLLVTGNLLISNATVFASEGNIKNVIPNTVTTMPVEKLIVQSFNYAPNSGPSANSIIQSGGIIQMGDVGLAVKDVQNAMVRVSLLSASDVDGYFGQKTKTAVINFQKTWLKHNSSMSVDGIVGNSTWACIQFALE